MAHHFAVAVLVTIVRLLFDKQDCNYGQTVWSDSIFPTITTIANKDMYYAPKSALNVASKDPQICLVISIGDIA